MSVDMDSLVTSMSNILKNGKGTEDAAWEDIAKQINAEYDKSVHNYRYLWANVAYVTGLSLLAVMIGCMLEPYGPITNERMIRSFEYLFESMALIIAMLFGNEATAYTATMNNWEACLNSVYTFYTDLQLYKVRNGAVSLQFDKHAREWTSRTLLMAIGAKSHAVRRKQLSDSAMSVIRNGFMKCYRPRYEPNVFDDYSMLQSRRKLISECKVEFTIDPGEHAELCKLGMTAVDAVIDTQRKLSEQSAPSGVTAYIYMTVMVVMVYMIVQSDGDLYSGIFSAYIIACSVLFPVAMVSTGSVKSFSIKIERLPGFKNQVYFTGTDACFEECVNEVISMSHPKCAKLSSDIYPVYNDKNVTELKKDPKPPEHRGLLNKK